jgi:hypothetical protein
LLRLSQREWASRLSSFQIGGRKPDGRLSALPASPASRLLPRPLAIAFLLALASMIASVLPDSAHAQDTYYTYSLQWTAPGDDSTIGRARAYDLRFATFPITEANWSSANIFVGVQAPAAPGTKESFTLFGLNAKNNYYVAMKTLDDRGNASKLSNVILVHSPLPLGSPTDSSYLAFARPWPNPARSEVRFAYELPHPGYVDIEAVDISGRRVRVITSWMQPAGRGVALWDLKDRNGVRVPPGAYVIWARLGDHVVTRPLIVER